MNPGDLIRIAPGSKQEKILLFEDKKNKKTNGVMFSKNMHAIILEVEKKEIKVYSSSIESRNFTIYLIKIIISEGRLGWMKIHDPINQIEKISFNQQY